MLHSKLQQQLPKSYTDWFNQQTVARLKLAMFDTVTDFEEQSNTIESSATVKLPIYWYPVSMFKLKLQYYAVPKIDRLVSLASTNCRINAVMSSESVRSLCMCSNITEFNLSIDIVERKYVFRRRRLENDLSAVQEEDGRTRTGAWRH